MAEIIPWLELQFRTNEIFAGLIAVSVMGSIFYALRGVPGILWKIFLAQYTVQLQIMSTDDAFDWIINWLGKQEYAKRTRRLKVSSEDFGEVPPNEGDTDFVLSPGHGHHFFFHNTKLVWLEREALESRGSGKPRETINFRVLGRSQDLVRNIISEAKQLSEEEEYIKVYSWNQTYWTLAARRFPRYKESLVLEEGQCERLLEDARDFLANVEWYSRRGVPWRRGYLLTGKPGTGKSSFVLIVATHFDRPVYSLNLNSVTDSTLLDALGELPRKAVLLLEDVDAAWASTDRKKNDKKEEFLTTSGLLNALDGVTSTEGRILFMTTNYPEKLDAALIRPGRVDLQEEFKICNREMIIRMFLIFYPREAGCARGFADKVERSNPSPATLQGIFIRNQTLAEIVNYEPTT